jgi:hypothetical protein
MSTGLFLQGTDKKIKETEICVEGYIVGHGHVVGPKHQDRRHIAEIAEKHGMASKEFLVIFREYKKEVLSDYKNCTLEELDKLPRTEKNVIRRSEVEFTLQQKEIKWLCDFTKKLIEEMEKKDNIDEINKKVLNLGPNGNLHDILTEYEYKCHNTWGYINLINSICEKALELGVNIEVG